MNIIEEYKTLSVEAQTSTGYTLQRLEEMLAQVSAKTFMVATSNTDETLTLNLTFTEAISTIVVTNLTSNSTVATVEQNLIAEDGTEQFIFSFDQPINELVVRSVPGT